MAIFFYCFLLVFCSVQVFGRHCYQAESNSNGTFPNNNYSMVQCHSVDAYCIKRRFIEINHLPSFSETTHFQWGCHENQQKPFESHVSCNLSENYRFMDRNSLVSEDICACCEDFCNNSTFDTQCYMDGKPNFQMNLPREEISQTTIPTNRQTTTEYIEIYSYSSVTTSLSVILGVAFIIVAILSYKVHKIRKPVTQDLIPIVVNEQH